MISGKAGCTRIHVGDSPRRLEILNQLLDRHDIQPLASLLGGAPFRLLSGMIRVSQYRERAQFWKYVLEQFNPFSREFKRKERAAREIAAGLSEAFDDPQLYRIAAQRKQDRNVRYRCHRTSCGAARDGKVDVAAP